MSDERDTEIIELEKMAWEINKSQDTKLMEKLVATEWVGVGPAGTRVNRRQAARMLETIKVTECDLYDPEVKWPSDSIAILTYKAKYSATFAGKSLVELVSRAEQGVGDSLVTSVWLKSGGSYKQVSYQETPIKHDLVAKLTSMAQAFI